MEIDRLKFIKNEHGIYELHINKERFYMNDEKYFLTDEEAERINKRLLPYTAVTLKIKEIKELAMGLVLEVKGEV